MKTERASSFAGLLGILSFIGMIAWTMLNALASSLSGIGDGAGSVIPASESNALYSGSIYLFLLSLSCLPFMRGRLLVAIWIAAHIIFAFFAFWIFATCGPSGIAILIPFGAFVVGWSALCNKRLKKARIKMENCTRERVTH